MIARQYFIRVRDSFNGWMTVADKDKLEFVKLLDDKLYGQFDDRIDVDWLASLDDDEFKVELANEINDLIDNFNKAIDPEVSNDARIKYYYISDLRVPGDLVGCGQ